MAYLGNGPGEAYTNTVKDSFNGDGSTTAFTMSVPSSTNDVRVVVENVIQDPTVAYSCAGTTLTFTSAPPSGTANIYVIHLGLAVMTTVPPSEISGATVFSSNVTVLGTIKLDGNYPVGTGNVALGDTALDSVASGGNYNTAIGGLAGTAITTGDENTFVGYATGDSITTASANTGVGYNALSANTSGTQNSAFGNRSGDAITTGDGNTSVGYFSLSSTTTANNNTAVGVDSLGLNSTGASNTAVGGDALRSNSTANHNTAVGYQSLLDNTTGAAGTALGAYALANSTTGNDNVATGYQALFTNTTGAFNTAHGSQALRGNTTASYNTAVGYQAGYSNTTAQQSTFIGEQAGYSNTTGLGNTFVGSDSGHLNTTGTRNQFFGKNSGEMITTGSKNTILGAYNGNEGGLDIRTSSNNIVLSDGDGNPRLRIDNEGTVKISGSVDNPGSSGEVGMRFLPLGFIDLSRSAGQGMNINRETSDGGVLHLFRAGSQVGSISVTASSTAYNTSSDYRLKENVDYTWDATTRLKQLKPARFNFISDADTTVDGFLAHEAQAVVPECVTGAKDAVDEDGNAVMQGIDQSKLVPLLVKTIQELEARITALEAE